MTRMMFGMFFVLTMNAYADPGNVGIWAANARKFSAEVTAAFGNPDDLLPRFADIATLRERVVQSRPAGMELSLPDQQLEQRANADWMLFLDATIKHNPELRREIESKAPAFGRFDKLIRGAAYATTAAGAAYATFVLLNDPGPAITRDMFFYGFLLASSVPTVLVNFIAGGLQNGHKDVKATRLAHKLNCEQSILATVLPSSLR